MTDARRNLVESMLAGTSAGKGSKRGKAQRPRKVVTITPRAEVCCEFWSDEVCPEGECDALSVLELGASPAPGIASVQGQSPRSGESMSLLARLTSQAKAKRRDDDPTLDGNDEAKTTEAPSTA